MLAGLGMGESWLVKALLQAAVVDCALEAPEARPYAFRVV